MNEQQIQTALWMIGAQIVLLLGSAALTPEQLRAEINDMIDPYFEEFHDTTNS